MEQLACPEREHHDINVLPVAISELLHAAPGGMTCRAIAERLGRPVLDVRRQLHQALAANLITAVVEDRAISYALKSGTLRSGSTR